jgi:hypothetical protein
MRFAKVHSTFKEGGSVRFLGHIFSLEIFRK